MPKYIGFDFERSKSNMETARAKVLSWIDENQDQVVEFLRDLVKIPTVNPGLADGDDSI